MRSTKNRLTHNSTLRGWICVLVCRCGCSFTTLAGGTEIVLTKRLDETTLNTLRRTLTAHSLKLGTETLQIV